MADLRTGEGNEANESTTRGVARNEGRNALFHASIRATAAEHHLERLHLLAETTMFKAYFLLRSSSV